MRRILGTPSHRYRRYCPLDLRTAHGAGTPTGPGPSRRYRRDGSPGPPVRSSGALRGVPIVLYDPLADRWLISQVAFTSFAPPYHQCVAVSRTGDPTGAYFLYDFVVPNAEFNDYPKFGVWPDAYYMTVNQFLNFGSFD